MKTEGWSIRIEVAASVGDFAGNDAAMRAIEGALGSIGDDDIHVSGPIMSNGIVVGSIEAHRTQIEAPCMKWHEREQGLQPVASGLDVSGTSSAPVEPG